MKKKCFKPFIPVIQPIKKHCGHGDHDEENKIISAIKAEIKKMGRTIMSKINEHADRQNVRNDKLDAAHAALSLDIQEMKRLIEELQNSSGEINEEDQALLDALEARSEAAVAKAEALDNLTPPVPPVA